MNDSMALVNVLRQRKAIFEQAHSTLPRSEIERLWQHEWSNITSLTMSSGPPAAVQNTLPLKRPAPVPLSAGIQGPPAKRSQPVGGPLLRSWSFGLTGPSRALQCHLLRLSLWHDKYRHRLEL